MVEVWTSLHKTNLEKFSIGDEAIIVHIVNAEGKPHLALFISFDTELGHSLDELYKG